MLLNSARQMTVMIATAMLSGTALCRTPADGQGTSPTGWSDFDGPIKSGSLPWTDCDNILHYRVWDVEATTQLSSLMGNPLPSDPDRQESGWANPESFYGSRLSSPLLDGLDLTRATLLMHAEDDRVRSFHIMGHQEDAVIVEGDLSMFGRNVRFNIVNSHSLIQGPGQYAIDFEGGVAYYWPVTSADRLRVENRVITAALPVPAMSPRTTAPTLPPVEDDKKGLTNPMHPDLNVDGKVNCRDISILLSKWGTSQGDLDGDGKTGFQDILTIFLKWDVLDNQKEHGTVDQDSESWLVLNDVFLDPVTHQDMQQQGISQYMMAYSSVQPDNSTGVVDVERLLQYVRDTWGDNPVGYGLLDYEIPYFDNLRKGPGDPDYQRTAESMKRALVRLAQEFPNARWAFFGGPSIPRWVEVPGEPWPLPWNQLPEDMKQELVERNLRNWEPILESAGWVAPCIYDLYEDDLLSPESQQNTQQREYEYIMDRLAMARHFYEDRGLEPRPILPMVTPYFGPGGNSVETRLIPEQEFIRDQIQPCLDFGTEGVAVWSAMDYYINLATRANSTISQDRIRAVLTENYLESPPVNWQDPGLKAFLTEAADGTICDRLVDTVETHDFFLEAQTPMMMAADGHDPL